MTKIHIIRLFYLIITVIWMITVFKFSNEPAKSSDSTSLKVTEKIIKIFLKKNMSKNEEQILIKKLDPVIRKLAHFTIYLIGGGIILNFINTFNISENKKVIYSMLTGTLYACTDEFHQLFVEGRAGEMKDVILDSLGVITGICIFLCLIQIEKHIHEKKAQLTNK